MSDDGDIVRASEIGQYTFCARAWWLQRVRGVASANAEQMAAGQASHAAHGRSLARAGRLRRLAFVLLALAAGLAVVLARTLVAAR